MFILPLLAVLFLVMAGFRVTCLLQWSRRSVIIAKILAAILFLVLAILILAAG